MGSIWDLGLKDESFIAKNAKADSGKVDLRLYGMVCLIMAILLAVVFVLILATSQMGGAALLPLLFAALIGPGFLAVIGMMLLRLARSRR